MPLQKSVDWRAVTPALAEVMSMLVLRRTFPEVALQLGLTVSAVRDRVERAKSIAGVTSANELSPWWLLNREDWLSGMAKAAGLEDSILQLARKTPSR